MTIQPGAMLGLLGGGQLGRMFTMAAHSMGYRVTVLDPAADSPAGNIAERHLCADYLDSDALHELGSTCAGVTTEFENVPAEALRILATQCTVSPDANCVEITQNRIREKEFLVSNGFPITPFSVIRQAADMTCQANKSVFPGILKISQFGYDGKGQVRVNSAAEAVTAFDGMHNLPCVLEQMMQLEGEISVVVARGFDNTITSFPAAENQHKNGILDTSIAPARLPEDIIRQAQQTASQIAVSLNYHGVLCVEFFVLPDGKLLVNEIAPRPHNSGHYTLDACITSQFEQQVRTLCSLPPGSTSIHGSAVMVNLLGEVWQHGSPDWRQVLQYPSARLHLYGKHEARPGRKMGHYTVLAETPETALQLASEIRQSLTAIL